MAQTHYDQSFNGSGPNGSYIRLYVTWTNSEANNTSTVEFQLESHVFNSGSYADDNPSWYIAVNGSSILSGTYNFSRGGHEVILGKITKTYSHDSNGDKSISVSAYFGGAGSGTYLGTATLSSTAVNLGNIARASIITSAQNVTLGNNCSIKWTPKSSNHKYKLTFSLGSWSYTTSSYISPSSTSAYTYSSYTIPLAVANQLPSATQGEMSVSLKTYDSSNNAVGSPSTKSFTVTVPSSIIPTISTASVSRINTGNSTVDGWGYYIQGMTKAKITASASGSYSSTIVRFDIQEVSGSVVGYTKSVIATSLDHTMESFISKSGTVYFKIVAVDSRGRSSAVYSAPSNGITVYQYSPPSIQSAAINRGSSPNTTNCILSVVYSYSKIPHSGTSDNGCTCTFKYKKKTDAGYTTYGTNITSGSTVTISGILEESSSYDFKIIVLDDVGNIAEYSSNTSTTAATMDFKSGGLGIAIGKMAEENNMFEVDWQSQFNDDVYIEGDTEIGGTLSLKDDDNIPHTIPDIIYPVGSIYMSVNSTSPASLFGGTWTQLKDRFLLGSGDTYSAGSMDGSATHTLTEEQLPSISGSLIFHGSENGSIVINTSGHFSGNYVGGKYTSATTYSGSSQSYTNPTFSFGSGQAHNNMPPYLTVYMWERVS